MSEITKEEAQAQANKERDEKISSIHEAMVSEGADVGTPEEFHSWFLAEGETGYKNRLKVYEAFKDEGGDVGGNYEEFRDWLFGKEPVTPPATHTPSANTTSTDHTVNATTTSVADESKTDTPQNKSEAPQPVYTPTFGERMALQQSITNAKKGIREKKNQAKRATDRMTPQGRSAIKAGKAQAQMAGTKSSVGVSGIGVVDPLMDAGRSPLPSGVVTKNGKPETDWLLADGSTTTDYNLASAHEAVASRRRLAHAFEQRMKDNGFDVQNKDNVRTQQVIDAIVSGNGFEDKAMLPQVEKNMKDSDLDPRNADHVKWFVTGDVESIMRRRLEVAGERLKELKQAKEKRQQERRKEGGFMNMLGRALEAGGKPAMGAGQIASLPNSTQTGSATSDSEMDKAIETATAEVAMYERAIREHEQQKRASGKGWLGKTVQGLWDGLTSPDTWTANIYSFSANNTLRNADTSDENGRRLTDAFALEQEAQRDIAQNHNPGGWYAGGKFAGEMLGDPITYMSGGVGNLARKCATSAITKTIFKGMENKWQSA